MFQRAHQHQRRLENSNQTAVRTVDYAPATPGKQTLTDQQHGGSLGAPDHYNRAIDATLRELNAIRTTALPNLVAIRRKQDLAPLTKQIELAKAAMQVRHMILSANAHVYALEKAATHDDPMVSFLRERIERLVLRATKLGVYEGALDMRPPRYIDDQAKKLSSGNTHKVIHKTTPPPPVHAGSFAPTKPAEIRRAAGNPKAGNTPPRMPLRSRTARGTGSVASAKAMPSNGARPAAKSIPAPVRTIQRKSTGGAVHANASIVAARGVESASSELPFASTIQRAFGRHSIADIRVQIGGAAKKASQKLGAKAYATGNLIAFAHDPDLHTAAHEAAHVVQQRAGLAPSGELDSPGDNLEAHADRVADAVVRGESAEALLDEVGGGSGQRRVQRKVDGKAAPKPLGGLALYLSIHENAVRAAIHKQLAETAWPDPAPDLGWQPGGVRMFARSIASAVMTRVGDAEGFRKLVYPANVKVALGHVTSRRDWSPEFGQTIAFQVERAAIAALTERIGPKYRELVARRVALPRAEELVGARAIDPIVARALTQAGVVDVTNLASVEPTRAAVSAKSSKQKATKTKQVAPSLDQLLAVERSITRAIDHFRVQVKPYGLSNKLGEVTNGVASRVVALVDGDEATRAELTPSIQFQHRQLLTIQPRVAHVISQLAPMMGENYRFSPARRERRQRLQSALGDYVDAIVASTYSREESTAILSRLIEVENDATHESLAQQAIDLDSSVRSAVSSGERAETASGVAAEQLERQRRAAVLGVSKSPYELQQSLTVAGEVALKNKMIAVGRSLDDLRKAADIVGFSDLAILRKAGFKPVPELIADVNGHLADVTRTWERETRDQTPAVQSDANAPADWADWQGRAAGLAQAQRAFSRIAGDQGISKFIQETQGKIRDEQFVSAVKTFGLTLVLTVATGGLAAGLGRGAAGLIGTGSSAAKVGAFAVDVAVNAAINSALQLALDPKATVGLTMLENTVTELVTRGVMRGVQKLQQRALTEARAMAQLPHLSAAERQMFATMRFSGADLTAQVVGGLAAQWVAREVKHFARDQMKSEADRSKPSATEPFAATVVQQGASIALGKYFHGRVHAWKQHRAQLSRSHVGSMPEAHALIEAREQFYRDARQLAESISPDPAAGPALAERDVALLQQEHALLAPAAVTVTPDSAATTLAQLTPPPDMLFGSHQRSRAEHFLAEMPAAQRDEFTALVNAIPDPVAKTFMFKALAAQSSPSELRWLAGEMAGKDRGWLIDNLTLGDPRGVGGGVTQQWSMSCNASMTITMRGNADPVFALRMRQQNPSVGDVDVSNPRAMNAHQAGLEKLMLETMYAGNNPNSPQPHRGRALPRNPGGGFGRYADDLLNMQSSATGVTYAPLLGPSPQQVLAILDLSVSAGMQVPLVIGRSGQPNLHYVLIQDRRVVGSVVEYSLHNPAGGDSIWMSAADIEAGNFGSVYDRVGTVEVPVASTTGSSSTATNP